MKLKKWAPLFFTNFLGVLNDNFLKYLVIFVGVHWVAKEQQDNVVPIAAGLLVLPFLIFSPLAGRLAKIKHKTNIIVTAKMLEFPIMLIACVGFFIHSIYVVMGAVLMMGVQSCLFSPAKIGLIKEVEGEKGISFGTGVMEMTTFMGVLLGTVLAGILSDMTNQYVFCGCLLIIAISGWLMSKKIQIAESDPEKHAKEPLNSITFIRNSFNHAAEIKGLNYSVLGLSTFWFIASLLQLNMTVHCPNILHMTNTETSIVMAVAAVGIGVGCWLAGLLSHHQVKLGFNTLGGIGLSICVTLIYLLEPSGVPFTILIGFTAVFSGFFKIPINANIQALVHGRKLGEVIAYANLVTFGFVLLSSGILKGANVAFSSETYTHQTFLIIALISWFITALMFVKVPGVKEGVRSFLRK